ncbi:MAG: DUF928 domain-containing protein [Coleofasciculaceae cyanobacterium SM2_3_26]|nr:DUF928 domain-containing protein [Coleofasciculaceae cyanobacterium SM2_3_26]
MFGSSSPSSTMPLEAGKTYEWSVAIVCNPSERTEDWVATGRVRRATLTAAQAEQLQQVSDLEKAAFYARSGIWFEAADTLVTLRLSDPENYTLAAVWEDFLKSESVNLAAIAQTALIDCYQEE